MSETNQIERKVVADNNQRSFAQHASSRDHAVVSLKTVVGKYGEAPHVASFQNSRRKQILWIAAVPSNLFEDLRNDSKQRANIDEHASQDIVLLCAYRELTVALGGVTSATEALNLY